VADPGENPRFQPLAEAGDAFLKASLR
jgi:hypothetical protein